MKRLVIAAVVLGALSGVVLWSNKAETAKANKPPADTTPKILALKEPDIVGIAITDAGGAPLVLKRDDGGKWAITAPKPLPADQPSVDGITSAVVSLPADRVVDQHVTNLQEYGLAPPQAEVDFTLKNGKTDKLLMGVATPTGSDVYAKLDGDPRLFTMSSFNKSALDKTVKDLRDKRLMTFDEDKVSQVELTAKHQTVVFGRIGPNEWQILKPRPMRADGFQVEDLVRKIAGANMDTAASDEDLKKADQAFATGTPIAIARVTAASGTQTLEVRKNKDVYYAKSSVVEGAHKVGNDVGEGLDKSLDDFRNKKLFDFGFTDPTRIEVKDGAKDSVYTKSGENWTSNGKTMDSTSVQAFVDKLRDISATKFVDTGFTTPTLELTVVSNDGKRTEKVLFAPDGANFIAKRDGEPSTLYQVDGSAVKDLREAASEVKEQPAAAPHK